jgi:phage baseplate assembly protein W
MAFTLIENDIVTSVIQNITIIATTPKGSDPLRPDFGSDLNKFIDRPITAITQGQIEAEFLIILEWEPRATLKSLVLTKDPINAKMRITYLIYIPELEQEIESFILL